MRNLFSATRFESEESTLPGLRWALEDADAGRLEEQRRVYLGALTRAAERTRILAEEWEALFRNAS